MTGGFGFALASAAAPYAELSVFSSVLRLVREAYVEPIDDASLVRAAVRGMLAALDAHSGYLGPEANARQRERASGAFHGVGLEVARAADGLLQVVAPIEGSPAAGAGLRPRDRIAEICAPACESARGLAPADAADRLRGPAGSVVTLRVLRDGWRDPREFELTRAAVRAPAVHARVLAPGFAVARVAAISEGAASELSARLAQLARTGGAPLRGLALDLRNNPGGDLEAAVALADLFLESGEIVSTHGRAPGASQRYDATPGGDIALRIVVLVNGGTASAAEVVAGALQDRRRALLLGEPSYGKGSVQSVFDLPDGSGLRLTTALYATPSGRRVEGAGLAPDIPVAPIGEGARKDVQLSRALETLRTPRLFDLLRAAAGPTAE
jgi:carboxyl-terminal processing protease